MAIVTSFTTATSAADAMATLNKALADIRSLQSVVGSPITISGTPPTTGQVGTAYSFTPTTANGSGTKAFSLSGGPLLAGLSFSSTTGAISGTPTAAGSMPNLVVTVTDSSGSASTTATSVTISASSAARTVGPAVTTDTGWQDLGTTTHSYRAERADSSESGSFGCSGVVYMFCDVGSETPTYGLKISNIGNSQYTDFLYRADGAWTTFSGGEANINWGRQLVKEDVVTIVYVDSTIAIYLNGTLNKKFPSSVFQSKFPNGLGRFARYVKTSGTYTQQITLSGVPQA